MTFGGISLVALDLNPDPLVSADWLELSALLARSGKVPFEALRDQQDLEFDQEPEDFQEREEILDNVVNLAYGEIDRRRTALKGTYPFEFKDSGAILSLKEELCAGCYTYIFSLVLSHVNSSAVLPSELLPATEEVMAARDLFQVCSCVAAAGHCKGPSYSIGWPRIDHTNFLDKFSEIFNHYGDGTPVDVLPEDAPDKIKDGGIDVVSWWPANDGRPGQGFLIGQVASGRNWTEKSAAKPRSYLRMWFRKQPVTKSFIATFIPFDVSDSEFRWTLVDHEHIIHRTRLPKLVKEAEELVLRGIAPIERYDELVTVQEWVERYRATTSLKFIG